LLCWNAPGDIAVAAALQWAADLGSGMNIVGVLAGTAVCAYTTGSQIVKLMIASELDQNV
jgi:hypothetical protein